MYILRKLSREELAKAYDSVFREAFPPEELKPLADMYAMMDKGQYEPLGLFGDGEACGYICNWIDAPYVLIDYLCVDRNKRNGGLGALIMEKSMEYYPDDTVFIGEVEAPEGDEEDELRLRRLGFYERCGARKVDYDTALFGVHYRTICWAKGPVDEAELLRRHDGFYRRNFPPERYAAAVQIPLRPGERVFDRSVWDQRPDSEREEKNV